MHPAKSLSASVLFERSVLLVLSSRPSVGKLDAPTLASHIDELTVMKRLKGSFRGAFGDIEEVHSESI